MGLVMPLLTTVEDAGHGAAEVDDAVGLTALQDGEADQRPAVGEVAFDIVLVDEVGQLVDVVEVDDVGAVEVGRGVSVAQVERVVAVVEEAQAALLIERVGVGVGGGELQAVAHALFDVRRERVVGIDARGPVVDGLCRVADVGNAVVDVAALVVFVVAAADRATMGRRPTTL